ncbi:MAG: site-specific DNA-methyltransferase, partial [Terriglobia bacterium]
MPKKTKRNSAPVAALRHKDKRANIPTEELRDFVAEDERQPKRMLYPRDPSLDPQLVWKGKDEQDSKDLEVPVVPVYIQEKIHPQALVEDLRRSSEQGQPAQADLFADFNGIKFDELVDFYHHEQNWSNRMILGDSLLVMTSLAEKEGLKGKVQMIYIDPPYGIRFGSNWQVSTRKRDVKDGKGEDMTRQPEQIRAFRDTWELGIHSYLSYLRDRLVAARELLTESGSVFVQIGDENVHLVRSILDEVFGRENFVCEIVFKKTGGFAAGTLASIADFVLWCAKRREQQGKLAVKYRQLCVPKDIREGPGERYTTVELQTGETRPITEQEAANPTLLPEGSRLFLGAPLTSDGVSVAAPAFEFGGQRFLAGGNQHWKTTVEGLDGAAKAGRIFKTRDFVNYKLYFDDFRATPISNIWTDTMGTAERNKVYVVQTATKVIERCLLMTTDPGDLVLDPTCGSGTTAYVAEQWGRRWITIDTSRVALARARTRLMAARFPYYLLADSAEGIRKEAEITGNVGAGLAPPTGAASSAPTGDIKKGFVYKRVPHVTLKSIANNEEIDAIHAKWQEKLEPLRAEINKALKKSWQEWEAPRPESMTDEMLRSGQHDRSEKNVTLSEAKGLLEQYWNLRRERQKEIDESIARHADTELLYDQPYEDSKRVRVTGPLTVESISPHRVLATDEERPASEAEGR